MSEWARPGARVLVTLPPDIAPRYDDEAYGATWTGEIVGVNGDELDVTGPGGDVEPVPVEYCRPESALP